MFMTLFWLGIIAFLISRWIKGNYDESPGSKNWLYSTDEKLVGLEQELSAMEYLHNTSTSSEERIDRMERDLERMNAIINLYKEWANMHKEEHKHFSWTQITTKS